MMIMPAQRMCAVREIVQTLPSLAMTTAHVQLMLVTKLQDVLTPL